MSSLLSPAATWRTAVAATILSLCILSFADQPQAMAAGPRALPAGTLPDDTRLAPLKDLNGYFPFQVPEDRAAWAARAKQVRERLLVSLGLWPRPQSTPLEPVVHGRRELDGYSVEKVYFQSMPGFYVTGNLYRPLKQQGKAPAVLCPHGHWSNGRFYDCGVAGVRKLIVQGAERFENGGRSPLQSRCVQLARMGCIVFHWDMIGYADSQQIPSDIIHGFRKQRPEMNAAQDWGLFSPQAESHMQSAMGLQAWNAIRALDFLTSLPEVDTERIAVTGASGGGTQTFILCAIDDRPCLSMPAVMVSTAMQGGCTCENACCLRVGTGNVEIAALFAPKPQGLTAADDWTVEMQSKGFPELQKLYELVGAKDKVMLKSLVHFDHNYNYVSRAAMYDWFNTHLQLGQETPIVEEDYQRLTKEELTVWDEEHPRPEGGPAFERRLLGWWHHDTQSKLAAVVKELESAPGTDSLAAFRDVLEVGVRVILGRGTPGQPFQQFHETARQKRPGGFRQVVGLLDSFPLGKDTKTSKEQLPVVLLYPENWNGPVLLWVTAEGKSGLFNAAGKLSQGVVELLESGLAVCGVDLLYQGEFLADGQTHASTRRVENSREAAAYTFGYNPSLFARRVQDVLTTIDFLHNLEGQPREVRLIGLGGAGPWAAAALSQAGNRVSAAAIETQGFRFNSVRDLHDPAFLPGGARYLDLIGMMALAAPTELWIAGEGEKVPGVVAAAYRAAGVPDAVTVCTGTTRPVEAMAIEWIVGR
jgi:dienelactone hydrolase